MATVRARLAHLTDAEWRARAEQLAHERHLIGAASYLGKTDSGATLWRVPSRSSDAQHVITVWENSLPVCTCTAGSYGRPCAHAGSALRSDEQRRRAMAQPDDPMRGWRMGGEW